jgi:hypothetical protein
MFIAGKRRESENLRENEQDMPERSIIREHFIAVPFALSRN